jgi:hypothetical protein
VGISAKIYFLIRVRYWFLREMISKVCSSRLIFIKTSLLIKNSQPAGNKVKRHKQPIGGNNRQFISKHRGWHQLYQQYVCKYYTIPNSL